MYALRAAYAFVRVPDVPDKNQPGARGALSGRQDGMSDTNGIRDARIAVLAHTICDLLAMIKKAGGHTWPHEQALMRRARAEVVELGGVVCEEDL